MRVPRRVTLQPWEIDVEAEVVEVEGDELRGGGLTVHADGEGFETTEEEETVEWCETDSGRVDEECESLEEHSRQLPLSCGHV